MDNHILASIGINASNFAEELPQINELLGKFNKAQNELLNYRAAHVDKTMDIFTALTKEILGEQWEVNDHIRTGDGWYFLYNTNWQSKSYIHLEWSGIKYDDLFCSTQYKLVLHAEGKYKSSEEVRLICEKLGTSQSKTTLFEKNDIIAEKPIGKMTKEEMYSFLYSVFNSPDIKQVIASIDQVTTSEDKPNKVN